MLARNGNDWETLAQNENDMYDIEQGVYDKVAVDFYWFLSEDMGADDERDIYDIDADDAIKDSLDMMEENFKSKEEMLKDEAMEEYGQKMGEWMDAQMG